MKKYLLTTSLIIIINFLLGCSTLQQGNDNDKQVYIFDEVPEEKTIEAPKNGEFPALKEAYYVVQIGAYTTEEKARTFTQIARTKTNYKCSIVYSDNLKLYLVQIIPFFKNREEAEQVRDNLKQIPDFYDVWILTIK